MPDITTIYDEDASAEEQVAAMQHLIDTGDAWRMEGSVGRSCMDAIESGYCILGTVGLIDFWGNYVPGRNEVTPGTKGSVEYAERINPEGPHGWKLLDVE